ncbi:hypothetical protein TorRG33x02_021880 [Trema orientale]|uniref:Uncharacterized protein n=1 Tax=Trema orientale TaxID=63057 RepID=A0A2P5FVS4_TREOI|nr:hypothetical protein TorRG33x02_021880 [Trema orientale]
MYINITSSTRICYTKMIRVKQNMILLGSSNGIDDNWESNSSSNNNIGVKLMKIVPLKCFCTRRPYEEHKHSGDRDVTEEGHKIILDHFKQKPYHCHANQKCS